MLTYCKSEVELPGQQNITGGTAVEETVVEGSLVETSANKKIAAEGTVNKKLEVN